MSGADLLKDLRYDLSTDCRLIKEIEENPDDYTKKDLLKMLSTIKEWNNVNIEKIDHEVN